MPRTAERAQDVCNAVTAAAPSEVCVMLDDAHKLGAEAESWRIIDEILNGLPANGHLLLSSRTEPPLPLSRLRANGGVEVLTETDLAFDEDERRRFAAGHETPVTPAAVPTWPALATLKTLTGHSASVEFVWDEVLDELGPDRCAVTKAPPHPGRDTDEVLGDWGFTAAEVARLRDGGAVR